MYFSRLSSDLWRGIHLNSSRSSYVSPPIILYAHILLHTYFFLLNASRYQSILGFWKATLIIFKANVPKYIRFYGQKRKSIKHLEDHEARFPLFKVREIVKNCVKPNPQSASKKRAFSLNSQSAIACSLADNPSTLRSSTLIKFLTFDYKLN